VLQQKVYCCRDAFEGADREKTFEGDIEVGGGADAASEVDAAEDGVEITA
jgi:hypothetical protein